jgi:metal-responsive CopG/Arc/MetJ family transcriptional regulator
MRKKIPEDKKKIKTGFTIDNDLLKIMDEYLDNLGISNRSKYIEKLITEDLEKRGKNIKKEF